MIRSTPPRAYPTPLPPGTRVRRNTSGQYGTVQSYTVSVGAFPVRWDDPRGTGAIWETCGVDDVTVITQTDKRVERCLDHDVSCALA